MTQKPDWLRSIDGDAVKAPQPNRHPVDELADVRSEIAALKRREEALRETVIAERDNRTGDEHEADVTVTRQERLDVDAVKREMGMAALRPFMRQTEVTTVRVKRRSGP